MFVSIFGYNLKRNKMKQLFMNGNATNFFFSKESTFNDILEWIQEQLMFSKENIFNLNEPHSCSLRNTIPEITINGDEDFVVITIKEIKPIL